MTFHCILSFYTAKNHLIGRRKCIVVAKDKNACYAILRDRYEDIIDEQTNFNVMRVGDFLALE